jgi:probable O-glycosylation ligase (exosortase A-associated)
MKQLAFMALTTLLGTAGSFALSPVYGVAVYYLYAVLRPQFMWEWSEALGVRIGEVNWSFPVALAALFSTLVWRLGLWAPLAAARRPWYGNPRLSRSHVLFLLFTAWISLTYVTALNQARAWPYFVEYVKIFVMFACAALVLREVRDLWVIYFVVLGSAAYIGYEINFFYLVYHWMLLQQRGYGGLDNNGAALILGMAVPMAFFAWEATGRWWRWAYLAAIPVLLHAILLSYSRGTMLSLIPTALLMLLRARNKARLLLFYAAAAAAIVLTTGKEIEERFLSIGSDSQNPRLLSWKIAVRMASDRPVFGFGIRNSNLYIFDYGADEQGRTIHSQYLQIAADSGWVALGIYAALLLSVFVGLWQVRWWLRKFKDPDTADVRSLAAGVECALFLFCFGAIFLSLEHVEMPYIVMLLGVQLHAIARAVMLKASPVPSGLPPMTLPYPYPDAQRPAAVSS